VGLVGFMAAVLLGFMAAAALAHDGLPHRASANILAAPIPRPTDR
jgi:uncharacterized protein involved in response to NO